MTLKKATQKLIALGLMLIALNFIYAKTVWYNDIDTHSDTLENLWPHQNNSDVIYFGESSNFYQEHPDTPKIRISDYLNRMLPNLLIEEVDNAGLWASNYLHIMRHIPKESKVTSIIVTMNLRSFGPTWIYDHNSNYLKRADELIKPRPKLLNRFMVSVKSYNYLAPKELDRLKNKAWETPFNSQNAFKHHSLSSWNSAIANGGILKKDGSWDMEKIPLASHFIKNYAFVIDKETNPRIKDFDQIVAYAKDRGWKLYFHLLSENTDEGQKLVGEELVKMMQLNVDLLLSRYHRPEENCVVINNFKRVPNAEFRDRTFPTEHYSNKGKRMCARNIAEIIKAN